MYAYNGDGVLVQAGTIAYTLDLAAPLSQVLHDGTASYLYGNDAERLRAAGGAWYIPDALGSVRATLDGSGNVLASTRYDPWGLPQASAIAPFGFTGEVQDAAGMVYLRARWYDAGSGRFGVRDPFAGWPETPYSLNPYQYAYAAPTVYTDPSGTCVAWGADSNFCATVTTWDRFAAVFLGPYDLYQADSLPEMAKHHITPQTAAEFAAAYWTVMENPSPFIPGLDDADWLGTPAYQIRGFADAYQSYFLGGGTVTQQWLGSPDTLTAYMDALACLDVQLDDLSLHGHQQRWAILAGMGVGVGFDLFLAPDGVGGGGSKKPKRTDHANQRRMEGRPVEYAVPEAQRARPSDIFIQSRDGRFVVRYSGTREHIFEPDGTQVTSLHRSKQSHQNILRRGDRRSATEDEVLRFKEIFK